MKVDRRKCQKLLRRIEALLREVDGYADPAASAHTYRVVDAILQAHGYVLERLFEHVQAAALETLGRDEAVQALFMLHGLHAVDDEPCPEPRRPEPRGARAESSAQSRTSDPWKSVAMEAPWERPLPQPRRRPSAPVACDAVR